MNMNDSDSVFFQPELFPQAQPVPEAFRPQEPPTPVDLLAEGFDVSPPPRPNVPFSGTAPASDSNDPADDPSTVPLESDRSIANSLQSAIQQLTSSVSDQSATLILKIRENKSSAFRKESDRYDGDGAAFLDFRDDITRHLRRHQFSPSISSLDGHRVFHEYPQINMASAKAAINREDNQDIIDDDSLLYDALLDSIHPTFRAKLGTAPHEAERIQGDKSGRLLWLAIASKIQESSSTLKHICDDLEHATLADYQGNVSDYCTRVKLDIQKLKGNGYDYNPNNRLTEAIFEALLAGTGNTVFTQKIATAYNAFNDLPSFQQNAFDVLTLLDTAVQTFTPLNQKKKWHWIAESTSPPSDNQLLTALSAEQFETLRADLLKLGTDSTQSQSKQKKANTKSDAKSYPPTAHPRYNKNNAPAEGESQTYTLSSGKIIKWCKIHGWNYSHLSTECKVLNSKAEADSKAAVDPSPSEPAQKSPAQIAGLSSIVKDKLE